MEGTFPQIFFAMEMTIVVTQKMSSTVKRTKLQGLMYIQKELKEVQDVQKILLTAAMADVSLTFGSAMEITIA